jgi:hypothetical protein
MGLVNAFTLPLDALPLKHSPAGYRAGWRFPSPKPFDRNFFETHPSSSLSLEPSDFNGARMAKQLIQNLVPGFQAPNPIARPFPHARNPGEVPHPVRRDVTKPPARMLSA